MKKQKSFLVAMICLILGFTTTISPAQQPTDDLAGLDVASAANLVVASVSGPATAILNKSISVAFTVKNQGDAASGAYNVGLYLSANKTINPATDRLLKNMTFAAGLAAGESKHTTTKVLVPISGLSGKYYYGAVTASNSKASSKQVSIVRYIADNTDTVTDYRTGLMWQKTDDGQQRNWADAKQYCGDLVLGGYDDWRLPRIDELETIVDYSRVDPAIDPLFVCRSLDYWSGSPLGNYTDYAWSVHFYFGYSSCSCNPSNYYVRCVRGGPW